MKGLVPLEARARLGAVLVPGIFASGDATHEPEKQIVVSAAGAKAARAATRQYVQNSQTQQ
ncbi:MAG: hypothetical protein M0005_06715 [Actinomycetota bacterium]|nr:hypothetical protein [Actinomycetota bacterium]